MDSRVVACLVLLLTTVDVSWAQAVRYEPLGAWVAPEQQASARWNQQLAQQSELPATRVSPETRPQLPGVRPANVELMEDAVLRKHPVLLRNSPERAGQVYLRRYSKDPGPLRGITAEALFIDRNPDWGYIKQANATQYDVYRRIPGQPRGQVYGQIKYHDSGDPATYARDMIKDYRAQRFFIPDDHVAPAKAYLAEQAKRLQASGDEVGAQRARRNYARLRGGGFSSEDVRGVTSQVGRYLNYEEKARLNQIRASASQRYAPYTALGAALAISFVPIAVDLVGGDITPTDGAYSATRAVSLIGVSVGTDQLLARTADGALRGTARGNIIIGTALAITDTTWLVVDHGWSQAFGQAIFYEEMACRLSAVSLGYVAFLKALAVAAQTGLWAPVIAFSVSVVAGTAGCFGAEAAAYQLIEVFRPEMHRQKEKDAIQFAKDRLDLAVADTRRLD